MPTNLAAQFSRAVASPLKHHIYLSRSRDPFLNLSIEHFLLQKSHPSSTVLFLYVNKPCVIIGRNQNPWLEVNLALVKKSEQSPHSEGLLASLQEPIRLVRRRSGGGTVFHDLGNVNYSVICPPAAFSRDKHAEMVVRAIRQTNPRARVNERHDIVLDPGSLVEESRRPPPEDTHRTAFAYDSDALIPRKVSGSAFKLTRQRSLHHGTCLVSSPNINSIYQVLRSPAKPFLKARGVDSVRSPIANIFARPNCLSETKMLDFQFKIVSEYLNLYHLGDISIHSLDEGPFQMTDDIAYGSLDDTLREIPEISAGIRELEVIFKGFQYCCCCTDLICR